MSLYRRERTGQGDHVDVALYEPLVFIVGDMILNYTGTGYVQGRVGNGTGSASPRGVYQAADGKWLSIAASNQGIATRLFATWVASRPRDEVLAVLDEFEVVCSQVSLVVGGADLLGALVGGPDLHLLEACAGNQTQETKHQ